MAALGKMYVSHDLPQLQGSFFNQWIRLTPPRSSEKIMPIRPRYQELFQVLQGPCHFWSKSLAAPLGPGLQLHGAGGGPAPPVIVQGGASRHHLTPPCRSTFDRHHRPPPVSAPKVVPPENFDLKKCLFLVFFVQNRLKIAQLSMQTA